MRRGARTRFLLALAAAAGAGEEPRVVHLDPRLADGSASADVLAAARSEIASFSFAGGAPGEFAVTGGEPRASKTGIAMARGAGEVPGLELARRIEADEINLVEVELAALLPGRARLRWRPAGTDGGDWPGECELRISYDGSDGGAAGEPLLHTLRFAVGSEPSWRGALGGLRLEPDVTRQLACEVRALRLVRVGFVPGSEPLESGADGAERAPGSGDGPGDGPGDGGLIELDGEVRRAWPVDFATALYASAEVPRGGRFLASVALAPRERLNQAAVHFAVDVGIDADGPWTVAATRSFVPADDPKQSLWHPLVADLSAWSGEEVRLRLRAFSGGDPSDAAQGLGASPTLARAYWGAPMLTPGELGERPSFLLVTLDTTRADSIGSIGAGGQSRGDAPSLTPYIDTLGRQGIVFESAWAPCNSTQPSHASILTGTWVQDHGVVNNFCLLAPENTTLAERLREAGYLTAGAVSQQFIGAGAGFGQGFDWFRQADPHAAFDGAPTLRAARDFVDQWATAGAPPFFLWLHLFDPHTPYTPTAEWLASFESRFAQASPPREAAPATLPQLAELPGDMDFLRGVSNAEWGRYMYRAEVSYADSLIENLASALAAHGRLDSTAIAVVADHGESLGERSSWFNHNGVFRETVHVPLILRVPGGPRGKRVAAPVSSIDIAPSFSKLAGLDARGLRGLDLLAVAKGSDGSTSNRPVWFEHSDGLQAGLVDGRYAFITTLSERMSFGLETHVDAQGRTLGRNAPVPRGTSYLYELGSDPKMERDLAAERPELIEAYLARLEAWRATAGDVRSLQRDVSEAEAEQMADIGYVDLSDDEGN